MACATAFSCRSLSVTPLLDSRESKSNCFHSKNKHCAPEAATHRRMGYHLQYWTRPRVAPTQETPHRKALPALLPPGRWSPAAPAAGPGARFPREGLSRTLAPSPPIPIQAPTPVEEPAPTARAAAPRACAPPRGAGEAGAQGRGQARAAARARGRRSRRDVALRPLWRR